jgi:hypothetical protein
VTNTKAGWIYVLNGHHNINLLSFKEAAMSEEYSFPEYGEELQKIIDMFGATKLETYKEKDITPRWDLKGGPLLWSYKYLYSAPKLDKIVISVQSF